MADDLLSTYRRLEVTEEELHTCQHVLVHTQKQLAELQAENDALRAQLQAAVAQPAAHSPVRASGLFLAAKQQPRRADTQALRSLLPCCPRNRASPQSRRS